MRPKGRETKASGGVRHGDSYKGIITDIDVYLYIIYSNICIYRCARIIATAFGLHIYIYTVCIYTYIYMCFTGLTDRKAPQSAHLVLLEPKGHQILYITYRHPYRRVYRLYK